MINQNLHIDKNRHLLRLERDDDHVYDLLTARVKVIRFDILSENKQGEDSQIYRAKMTLGPEDNVLLELKDYRDNTRRVRGLDSTAHLSDAFALALAMAWNEEEAVLAT